MTLLITNLTTVSAFHFLEPLAGPYLPEADRLGYNRTVIVLFILPQLRRSSPPYSARLENRRIPRLPVELSLVERLQAPPLARPVPPH
jgi:hypothetical protein